MYRRIRRRVSYLLADLGNEFNLYESPFGKPLHGNSRPSGQMIFERTRVHLIERREIVHVVKKTRRFDNLIPADSRIAPIFRMTCSDCSSTVFPTSSPVCGSRAIWPDANKNPPATTPCT